MKRTININIAGITLDIDSDAYEYLKQYLQKVQTQLGNNNEAREIIADIEARVAELLKNKLNSTKQVLTYSDIEEVIATIGQPSEFTDDTLNDSFETSQNNEAKGRKRLYRNIDRKVIGGVCSGLAAYMGIDPVILRIAFLLAIFIPFLAGSFMIPLYIILWIAMPAARTNAQKLEMMGEPVTIQNLQRFARDEFEELKRDFSTYKKSGKFQEFLYEFLSIVGNFFRIILKGLAIFVGAILLFVGVVLLMALIGGISGHGFNISTNNFSLPSWDLLFSNLFPAYAKITLAVCLLFIIVVPIAYLIYLVARAFFKSPKVSRVITISAVIIWFAAVFGFGYTVVGQFKQFKQQSETNSESIITTSGNKLTITTAPNAALNHIIEVLEIEDYSLYKNTSTGQLLGKPNVIIKKSADNTWTIVTTKRARGADFTAAQANAEGINYSFSRTDSCLLLNPWFELPEDNNWRLQELHVIIYAPVGAKIYIDYDLSDILGECDNASGLWAKDMAGKNWLMTNDGLIVDEITIAE